MREVKLTEAERIARLEAQHSELMRIVTETNEQLKDMKSDMNEVRDSLVRWKGIGAGIAISVSLVWSVAVGIYHIFSSGKV